MTARTTAHASAGPSEPRFDAKFIEEHRLVERYLDNKLPLRGALDLENWCRAHPEYLDALKLSERAQASIKPADGRVKAIQPRIPPRRPLRR